MINRIRGNRAAMVVILILLSAAVRLTGLDYAVPFHFHVDEQLLLTSSVRLATDPHQATHDKYFFNYGSLPRCLLFPPVYAAHKVGRLNLSSPKQVTALYLLARAISACFGIATVLLVYFMGKHFLGAGVGWAAAGILAFSPLHLRDSHFFTPDVMLTFFLTATLGAAALFASRPNGRRALLAGLMAGLAMATKANAAAGLLFLLIALWHARKCRFALLAAGACVLAFLVGNWPVLLAPQRFFETMKMLSSWASGSTLRQADLQFVDTKPWLYWLGNLLYYGAGPIMLAAGIGGAILLGKRARSEVAPRLILALSLPYFLVLGASFQKFMRFSLPLHPVLALCAGALIAVLWKKAPRARIVLLLILAAHLLYGLAYSGVFLRQDPRILAGHELNSILPEGTTVLLETTHSNPPLIEEDWNKGLFRSYLPRLGKCMVTRSGELELLYLDPYIYLFSTTNSPEQKWRCIEGALQRADVVIIGPRYRDQYLRLPHRFPLMARYYREMERGKLGFFCAAVYSNRARLGPLLINDSASELTFRLFDRPELRVYARPGTPAWEAICRLGRQ